MYSLKTKNPKMSGFSLIEILISLSVMSVVSLGVAYNMANLYKNQEEISARSDTKNFMSNMRAYLSSTEFCENELVGQAFPLNTKRDLEVQQMVSLGNKSGTLKSNTEILNGIKINKLSLEHKTSIATQSVFDGTNNLSLVSGRISIAMQNKDKDNSTDWIDLKPTTVDIPLLLDSSNVIQSCGLSASLDPQIACASVGSDYDATSGECEERDTCTMRGTYTTWKCTPSYSSCGGDVQSHVNRVGANVVTSSWGQRVYTGSNGGGIVNSITKALSCPPGSVPEVSGTRTASYNINTGKKSSQTIREESTFFVCMECN